jgi:hypothetical protein
MFTAVITNIPCAYTIAYTVTIALATYTYAFAFTIATANTNVVADIPCMVSVLQRV